MTDNERAHAHLSADNAVLMILMRHVLSRLLHDQDPEVFRRRLTELDSVTAMEILEGRAFQGTDETTTYIRETAASTMSEVLAGIRWQEQLR